MELVRSVESQYDSGVAFSLAQYFTTLQVPMVTLISTVRAAFSTKSSPALICNTYPPREVLLHTFGEPHYIR